MSGQGRYLKNMEIANLVSNKNTICRICLELNTNLTSLFDHIDVNEIKRSLELLLLECTSIQISRIDRYPQNICKICCDHLKSFYLFKQKCYKSLEQFKKALEGSKISFAVENKLIQKDTGFVEPNDNLNVDDTNKNNISDAGNDSFCNTEPLSNSDVDEPNSLDFSCETCGKTFLNKLDYKNHEKEHSVTTIAKFLCTICGKKFTRHSSVKRHMTTHTGLKPYSCSYCNSNFTQSGTLSLHLRIHKENENLKKIEQKPDDKLNLCSICGKSFKQTSSLTVHLRRHSGERPYSCNICHKRFISNSKLSSHARIHTGERPYSCKYCQKSFSQSTILNKHVKTHLDIKQYQCSYCPKLFSSSYYRNIHIRKHTGEKPLICNICQKSFSDPKNLKEHTAIHNESKPFLCVTCGKTFRRIHHLRFHMKTHSKNQ
ncbi:unnamed protein product [Psylliodes chrysocephalus]|uniref:Uncharacterized protein n=1 Tax=Psylliodes chrysocephalus TaxID=3402493 RepID=A0A9P0GHC3_9CUCU|nr:unnamed protein product [Psylliodes chrysocephala]